MSSHSSMADMVSALDAAHAAAKEYLLSVDHRPVFPTQEAVEALSAFDKPLPSSPSDPLLVIEELRQLGSPATTATMGGRYFGYVTGGVLPGALAARQLAGVWDQNSALNSMSPIASSLEHVCEGWVRELLQLPESTCMGLVTGTSMSLACGFVAARNELLRRKGWDASADGLFGAPPIRVVLGEAAHGAVWKALAFIGLGKARVEKVPCDTQGRIIMKCLPALDDNTILILSAGNVNTGAFDDFESIMPVAVAAKAWVHVDGAFGMWASASPRLRHLTKGAEMANSWSCDAHKTLNTPYDCGLILCRDKAHLVNAMQASGSYLQFAVENARGRGGGGGGGGRGGGGGGGGRDGMLFSPDMSRRARGIELWAALKSLGASGVADMVDAQVARARQFADGLRRHFYVLNDVVFNQVAVALDSDEDTDRVLALIQEGGECWVGGSSIQGKKIIRISVCSNRSKIDDISRSVQSFIHAKELLAPKEELTKVDGQ